MKRLLVTLSALFLSAVAYADDGPFQVPPGPHTSVFSYVIYGPNGQEVDKVEHSMGAPLPYLEALALRYVRLNTCIGGDQSIFVELATQTGGSFKDVLIQKLQQ